MNSVALLCFSKFCLFKAVMIFTSRFMASRNCWNGFDWQELWRVEGGRGDACSLLLCGCLMNQRNWRTSNFSCHSSSPLPNHSSHCLFSELLLVYYQIFKCFNIANLFLFILAAPIFVKTDVFFDYFFQEE